MTTKEFIHEAVARLEKSGAEVLYLHPDNVGVAVCAIVSVEWLNRHAKAEAALMDALSSFPETTDHDHLTEDE